MMLLAPIPRTMESRFDDPHVMAGNGTIGLEILEDLPGVDAIVEIGNFLRDAGDEIVVECGVVVLDDGGGGDLPGEVRALRIPDREGGAVAEPGALQQTL
jgi:hypothetical protein